MLQQFVDPVAIAAQIKRVQAMHCGGDGKLVRPAGPGAPPPGAVAEELIEILDGHFLDGRSFRDPCIGDKDVQAISDNAAGLPGKLAGAVRGGKIRRLSLIHI